MPLMRRAAFFQGSHYPPSVAQSLIVRQRFGGHRLLRAYGEVRASGPLESGAATPTAFRPRPSWVPDEVECRVLLKLPYTN
jgi:hypothetical protein